MIRRLRTFTLWTGTLLSVLIAGAFVVSAWWMVAAQAAGIGVDIVSGSIGVGLGESAAPPGVHRHPWGLSYWNYWTAVSPGFVTLPLYAVFAAVAIPTLLVWRFVPKFPRGHCRRCGYNLTGLTEARCSECGEAFGEKRPGKPSSRTLDTFGE